MSIVSGKKSIMFSDTVTTSVELLLIMILMGPGTYMVITMRIQKERQPEAFCCYRK
jgi:hypothetical protein